MWKICYLFGLLLRDVAFLRPSASGPTAVSVAQAGLRGRCYPDSSALNPAIISMPRSALLDIPTHCRSACDMPSVIHGDAQLPRNGGAGPAKAPQTPGSMHVFHVAPAVAKRWGSAAYPGGFQGLSLPAVHDGYSCCLGCLHQTHSHLSFVKGWAHEEHGLC